MRNLIIALALLTTAANAETITLNLVQPITETRTVTTITVRAESLISVARPWIDPTGNFGREIKSGDLSVDMGVFVDDVVPGIINEIAKAIENGIQITKSEMDASALAIGIDGSWAGGVNEVRTTIHAIMRKVATIAGQPEAWADAYYVAIEQQIMEQMGQ